MSIPVFVEEDTVGKLKVCWECIFVEKKIYSQSLLWVLPYKMVVQEKEGMIEHLLFTQQKAIL